MGQGVSEGDGNTHHNARATKNFIILSHSPLLCQPHLQLLLVLLAYLCHPTSRAPITNLAPAHSNIKQGQEKDRKSPAMWSCDNSWLSVGLVEVKLALQTLEEESEKARQDVNEWEWQKPLDRRKICTRTFRSMDLNVRRRLGLRRQRDDDDQHVLVEHHRRCRL